MYRSLLKTRILLWAIGTLFWPLWSVTYLWRGFLTSFRPFTRPCFYSVRFETGAIKLVLQVFVLCHVTSSLNCLLAILLQERKENLRYFHFLPERDRACLQHWTEQCKVVWVFRSVELPYTVFSTRAFFPLKKGKYTVSIFCISSPGGTGNTEYTHSRCIWYFVMLL